MSTAYVIVTVLAAAAVSFTVTADLLPFFRERVLSNMARTGVPESWLPKLMAVRATGVSRVLRVPPVERGG